MLPGTVTIGVSTLLVWATLLLPALNIFRPAILFPTDLEMYSRGTIVVMNYACYRMACDSSNVSFVLPYVGYPTLWLEENFWVFLCVFVVGIWCGMLTSIYKKVQQEKKNNKNL